MRLRCRPGDMAVVVKGSAVGTFVDVIMLVDVPIEKHPTWECCIKGPCRVAIVHPVTLRIVGEGIAPVGTLVLFKDNELQPIRPPKNRIASPAPPVTLEN